MPCSLIRSLPSLSCGPGDQPCVAIRVPLACCVHDVTRRLFRRAQLFPTKMLYVNNEDGTLAPLALPDLVESMGQVCLWPVAFLSHIAWMGSELSLLALSYDLIKTVFGAWGALCIRSRYACAHYSCKRADRTASSPHPPPTVLQRPADPFLDFKSLARNTTYMLLVFLGLSAIFLVKSGNLGIGIGSDHRAPGARVTDNFNSTAFENMCAFELLSARCGRLGGSVCPSAANTLARTAGTRVPERSLTSRGTD